MLAVKMVPHICSHSVVENPCSAMYMGRNTGKANCAVVLMIRTIPPSKTLGSSRMIVRPFASSSIFEEAPVDADGNLDLFSTSAKNAPTNTQKIELHRVSR